MACFVDLTNPSRTSSLVVTPKSYSTATKMSTAELQWEAVLTLTTFCAIRHHAHRPWLDDTGIDLRDASYILGPKFKETLNNLQSNTSDQEGEKHSEVLLWVYFIGAISEQRKTLYHLQMFEENRESGTRWWFTRKLADQARLLKATRWDEARTTLERFAYGDEILEPNPKN